MNAVSSAKEIDTNYTSDIINEKNDDIKKQRPEFVKNIDKSLILNIIDDSLSDDNVLQCVEFKTNLDTEIKTDTSNKNVVIINNYGHNDIPYYVSNIDTKYFTQYDDIAPITNPNYNFLKIIEGRRNVYFQNSYRGIYRHKFISIYEDDIFKLNCADYLFTPTNGKLNCSYIHDIDNKLYVNLDLFSDVRAYDYLKSVEQEYVIDECKKCKFNTSDIKIANKYKIVAIPKDIMKIFNRITADYKEALKYLFLNEKIGYYCYKYDENTIIPVICKHQIMLLEGVNTIDIANECYKNGLCKYCGQEMIAYNQAESISLHPTAVSLIILFSECFKENISEEEIIHIVSNFIIKRLEKDNINFYSNDQCIGYTCLYILKLINLCKPTFKMIDYKIRTLINKISNNLSILGKSEQDIKNILESDMFGDIDSVITLLKSEISKDDKGVSVTGIIAEDVLFNSINDREPKTKIQKLYIEDKWRLYDICKLFEKEYNKLYNVSKYTDYDLTSNATVYFDTIHNKINSIGFIFFQIMGEHYCPVNIIHEYKNNVCIHCGLNKDGKNAEKIYNKYSNIINNAATEEPNTLTIKEEKKTKHELIIDNIKKTNISDFKDILFKYNITFADINTLENSIKKFNYEYFTMMATIIGIDYDELIEPIENYKLTDYVKQIFKYVIKMELSKEETVVNLFYSCYNTVDNIEILI